MVSQSRVGLYTGRSEFSSEFSKHINNVLNPIESFTAVLRTENSKGLQSINGGYRGLHLSKTSQPNFVSPDSTMIATMIIIMVKWSLPLPLILKVYNVTFKFV